MSLSEKVEFCGRVLDWESPPVIVAEIGFNHNGDVNLAKKMIESAGKNGADAVKLQTFIGEEIVSKTFLADDPDKPGREIPLYQFFKRYELEREDYGELFKFAEKLDFPLFSTPFDEASLDMLVELGCPAVKVASCDLTHHPFLRQVARKKLPVVLSTGMGNLDEVEMALAIFRKEDNHQVILLHCVSNYPSSYEEMNLRCLPAMRERFRVHVGFSDHSPDDLSSMVACSLGAVMIEKHFTIDRNLPGVDQSISMDPDDLRNLKEVCGRVFKTLGSEIKQAQPSEIPVQKAARRSIISKVDMEPGCRISPERIGIKRPGTGISPVDLDRVLGKCVKVHVAAEQVITWEMI